jgi:hypothetical protein
MILTVNYEELLALRAGKRIVLDGRADSAGAETPSYLPTEGDRAAVRDMPALDGDLSVSTLADAERLETGLNVLASALHAEMNQSILVTHPASEDAVASYFEYAHVLSVLGRVEEMRASMEDVIELVSGGTEGDELLSTFVFPD